MSGNIASASLVCTHLTIIRIICGYGLNIKCSPRLWLEYEVFLQLLVLFWDVLETSQGVVLLQEISHWGGVVELT